MMCAPSWWSDRANLVKDTVERAVGRAVLVLQPGQHLLEPGLDLGCRPLDLDRGHPVGQDELGQPGDVHFGGHPAVALPIDADEHLRLGEMEPYSAWGGW
jgi:hypothetical protein